MSFGASVWFGVFLLWSLNNLARAQCIHPGLIDVTPQEVADYKQRLAEDYLSTNYNKGIRPPDEVAALAKEDLASFAHVLMINPEYYRMPSLKADAFVGHDYTTDLPDLYVIPGDSRIVCALIPGTRVFLSDGFTHHYATLYDVDYSRQNVTLLDPWAPVSFLLEGHNVAGVKARSQTDDRGLRFLSLTFREFITVLHGVVGNYFSDAFFENLEVNYPELKNTPEYVFWKTSRLYATGNFDIATLARLHMLSGPVEARSSILESYYQDAYIGIMTDFSSQSIADPVQRAQNQAVQKAAFVDRLKQYAIQLPWPLRWQLLERTRATPDIALRLVVAKAWLDADPSDTDIRAFRAENLLRAGRASDALQELREAYAVWEQNVGSSVDVKPPSRAIEHLLSQSWGLQTTNLLTWSFGRLRLLTILANVQLDKSYRPQDDLMNAAQHYPVGNLYTDYLYESLWIAFDSHDDDFLKALIVMAAEKPEDGARRKIEEEIFRFFTERRSIYSASAPIQAVILDMHTGEGFCAMARDAWEATVDQSPPLVNDARKLCESKGTIRPSQGQSNSVNPPSSDGSSNSIDRSVARLMVGRWRFPNGQACSFAQGGMTLPRFGLIDTDGLRLTFIWYFGKLPANRAVERILRTEGNTIYTVVEDDLDTPTSEIGQKIRYTVTPSKWTSENLTTHQVNAHNRCN